jgi:hypothetical protein
MHFLTRSSAQGTNRLLIGICMLSSFGLQAMGATLEGRNIALSLSVTGTQIQARLTSPALGEVAAGPYLWHANIDGEDVRGLASPRVEALGNRTVLVTGKLGPLEVEQRFELLEDGSGLTEIIRLRNPTGRDVVMDDIRTGFTRKVDPEVDPFQLVAVPYRRQADGSMHDYSMAAVATMTSGQGKINPTSQPAWQPVAPLVDDAHRRLRSESWILTDGANGLLVLKYNNEAVEHSAVNWMAEENLLVFGGCAFVLHKEPVQATRFSPGETFRFGQTRYLFYPGGWPEGYEVYKAFINSQGHGLTEDYDPQVQWNILFDLGDSRWPLEKVLEQAALAKDVGCTRIYFDPGWQVPTSDTNPAPLYGSALWDEQRLGPLKNMVGLMRDSYGLELGLWTASRVADDLQWPEECYRRMSIAQKGAPRVLGGRRNLALLPEAKSAASSVFDAGSIPIHQIPHLNDGIYGNEASWIAGEMPAWVEIDLGAEHRISQVCLGNDNAHRLDDRATSSFRILTATRHDADSRAATWHTAAEYAQYGVPLVRRMAFDFKPVTARWVRIELLAPLNELVRIDEIEIYEADGDSAMAEDDAGGAVETLETLRELCMSHQAWRAERIRRLSELADDGLAFLMFDFHGWNGPCYAEDHGHPVPSTTRDHIDSIYGVARELRRTHPNLRIEMHDAIWPWGSRYLPGYFRQGLTDGDYDENWAYEFMWNSIHDLRSGQALCLYYYNLAYDIPMYLHFNMTADNDQNLVFWWMASTVRHIGFGGLTHDARKEPHGELPNLTEQQQQVRFKHYKEAMATYTRLKRYFTHGAFIGIDGDETLHLRTLPGKPGGVLLVFNLTTENVARAIRIPLGRLNLDASAALPPITGAKGELDGNDLVLKVELGPESPALLAIGLATDSK